MLIGQLIGPYRVFEKIGEGGMGQVFRARDTKLNRDVALKVLPDSFANDADRLARFTREAQTLASLNHPNIAHIHGLEESDGITALVMELVEGDDLSQLIARLRAPGAWAGQAASLSVTADQAKSPKSRVQSLLKPTAFRWTKSSRSPARLRRPSKRHTSRGSSIAI